MSHRPPPLPVRILDILRRQDRLITRDQAISAGLSPTQVEGHLRYRRWNRVAPRVYLASTVSATAQQTIRAVALWAGPSSVIIGAAALFWQRRRPEPPAIIDIAVDRHMRMPIIRFTATPMTVAVHRRALTEDGVVRWGGILTARTELAVYDLLPVEGPALLDDAIRQRWLTLPMVQQVHRTTVTGRGTTVRSAVITAAATGGISEGERLLHHQLRVAGITGWRANGAIYVGGRTRVGDAVFDELKLVIEVDGFAFHSSHQRFHDDRSRQNDLVGSDWAVLRFTWWHLKNDPDSAMAQVRRTIAMLERRNRPPSGT